MCYTNWWVGHHFYVEAYNTNFTWSIGMPINCINFTHTVTQVLYYGNWISFVKPISSFPQWLVTVHSKWFTLLSHPWHEKGWQWYSTNYFDVEWSNSCMWCIATVVSVCRSFTHIFRKHDQYTTRCRTFMLQKGIIWQRINMCTLKYEGQSLG